MSQTIDTGDHVWWGDPAHPDMGVVITISRDGRIAYIKLDYGRKRTIIQKNIKQLRKQENLP